MESEGLSLTVERGKRGVVVWVGGEIDLKTAPQLDACLREVGSTVTLDFSGVTFMDSSGLSVLAAAAKRVARQNGELVLRGVHARERRILEITSLDELVTIEEPRPSHPTFG